MSLLDAALPRALGPSFRWLVTASAVNQFGDGLLLAASPLLVASLTSDPLLIAMAPVLQRLPLLLLGLGAGAYVDRVDRQRLLIGVDAARAVGVAGVAALVFTGAATITHILVAVFVLGVAEAFADIAAQTMLPSTVAAEDLGTAQPRMMATYVAGNELVGPPVGAALFAAGHALPLAANAICFAAGAWMLARMTITHVPAGKRSAAALRHDVGEGLRWLAGNAPVRTLTLTITLFNVTWGAAWAVLVVWARERLGLTEVGYGLLSSASAVGGVVAIVTFGPLTRRITYATLMRGALVVETLVHLTFALTTLPVVAYVAMFSFGVEAFLWGTTSTTVRQRLVPHHLLGRVGSVVMIGVYLGVVVGGVLGGLIARQWGVTSTYWFAVAGNLVLLAVVWGQLGHLAGAQPHPEEAAADS